MKHVGRNGPPLWIDKNTKSRHGDKDTWIQNWIITTDKLQVLIMCEKKTLRSISTLEDKLKKEFYLKKEINLKKDSYLTINSKELSDRFKIEDLFAEGLSEMWILSRESDLHSHSHTYKEKGNWQIDWAVHNLKKM